MPVIKNFSFSNISFDCLHIKKKKYSQKSKKDSRSPQRRFDQRFFFFYFDKFDRRAFVRLSTIFQILIFQSRRPASRIRRRFTAWRSKKRQTYLAKWTRTRPRFNSAGPSTIPPRASTLPPVISPGPAHPPSSRTRP